ncbi:MAG: response regulator [Cyanobacteria bacterium RM1_2_2]|nr:response regulator [Cyanobacteria bacterium RM1_2_2]
MPAAKILVVEDERLIAYDIQAVLEGLGYVVFEPVSSAEIALTQMATLQPDLVLMDIYLDGEMDGVEASAQIQTQFDIPVVFLTANADPETLDRIKAIQPFGYVLKPYNEKELSTTIAIALSRHQAEVEVRQALMTAETQWAETKAYHHQKSKYLAMTAHELRNPLVVIQFAAEMLQERGEQLSKTKQQRHFQRIQVATNDLNETLDKLLLLEQIEADKLPYEPAPLEVVGFCRDFVAALQITVGDLYALTFAAPVDRCVVNLDAKLVAQLLNNLFANAIKYSPEGSLIELALAIQSEQITLQIRDAGIGIPPADCPQVFHAFYRASNVSQFSGSGLGLTIAKQCVDLHQGQIWIESTLGKGTVVFVSLPR